MRLPTESSVLIVMIFQSVNSPIWTLLWQQSSNEFFFEHGPDYIYRYVIKATELIKVWV